MSYCEGSQPIREGFRTAIETCGYFPCIIDEVEHNGQIVPEIFYEIGRSRFLVADVTYPNYGAYYEAGYAQGMIAKGIQSTLSSYITDAIDLQLAGRPCDPESKQLLVKLYIYGLYGFIIEWINGDMEGDFQQTSGRIMDMCEKLLNVYLDTMLTGGELPSSD